MSLKENQPSEPQADADAGFSLNRATGLMLLYIGAIYFLARALTTEHLVGFLSYFGAGLTISPTGKSRSDTHLFWVNFVLGALLWPVFMVCAFFSMLKNKP